MAGGGSGLPLSPVDRRLSASTERPRDSSADATMMSAYVPTGGKIIRILHKAKGTSSMKLHTKIGATTTAALATAGLVAGISSASASASDSFTVQASAGVPAVHLTASEKSALQAKVDKQLKNYGGGTQTGINQVSYMNGTLLLTLALPGEKKARAIDEPVTPLGVANCASQYACIWTDTNFNGTRLSKFDCGTLTLAAPFNSSLASIHNNQTTGTQTLILNSSHAVLNANMAPSRINDAGVANRSQARFWTVCP
jgi:hypothetical protein